jgi:hypothetical protein
VPAEIKPQKILNLRPTQFAVGLYEIHQKTLEVRKLMRKGNAKKLSRYLQDKTIPVVRSPHGHLFITDHHHHALACLLAGIKRLPVELKLDLTGRQLGFGQFWRLLQRRKLAYLYDQFGEGPRSALYLPDDVRGMADDPYRSIAWAVRQRGACDNSDICFSEFAWADFFRKRKLLDRDGPQGFEQAVARGEKLARQACARHLPGTCPASKKPEFRPVP